MSERIPAIDVLEQQIGRIVASSWPAFAAEHPALAQVIDQSILTDHVAHSLADDAAFQAAWEQARDARIGVEALTNLVQAFVAPVLRRLT